MLLNPYRFGSAGGAVSSRWRILVTGRQSGTDTTVLREVEMHATIGGADECNGGTGLANEAPGGFEGSKAFDDNVGTWWSTNDATLNDWLEYQFLSAKTIEEVQMVPYLNANSPNAFDVQYFNGSGWVTYWSISNSSTWEAGGTGVNGTKIFNSLGHVWKADNQNSAAGNTSYTDPYATMGIHVTPTSNLDVRALTIDSRMEAGATYEPVIYQVNSSTLAFISEIAVGPSQTVGSQTLAERIWPFTVGAWPTLVSGNRYFLGLRRTDGTGTSNAGLRFFNGGNSFPLAPLTINGNAAWALKVAPGVGVTPGFSNSTTLVWTIGVVFK